MSKKFENLTNFVRQEIRKNGIRAISGPKLAVVIEAVIQHVGEGASFLGLVNEDAIPVTPEGAGYYFGIGKTFPNFNYTGLNRGIHILIWNGKWQGMYFTDLSKSNILESSKMEKIDDYWYLILQFEGEKEPQKIKIDDFFKGLDDKLAKKLEKVYVDNTSIQGDGTKNNPLKTTLPADFEELLSYGVSFSGADPKGTRVGNMDLHRKLPLQTQMRKCTLLDNGDVNYWLDPNNSLLKENGNSAILDGRDGQVMVFLPQFWYKVSNTSGGVEYRISEKSISGYTHSPACYISAYEASLMRGESILSSVVNNTANYRGGNNNAEWDETQQSLLGKPATSISLTNFIKYASNRGENWYCNYYDAYKKMCFLYLVEYANRNSQAEFIANPTDEGFKQGGLGDGVTTLDDAKWSSFNSYNPFTPCGYTNGLGNNTGTKDFTMPSEYGELVVSVPSYRGIENPFGHIWKWTDGLEVVAGEETTELKVNGKYVGDLARDEGYIKSMLGEEIMPVEVGGGSTSYWCDRFYTNAKTSQGIRGVHFGGHAAAGSPAGLFYSLTHPAPSAASASLGSRLCFFKRA